MSHVILERSYTEPLPTQMSLELWDSVNHSLDVCLNKYDWQWLRSFITLDGSRSICELEVPYAEVVREACRKASIPFDRVWRAEIWPGMNPDGLQANKQPILAEFTYEPPMTPETWTDATQRTRPCCIEMGIQSLVTLMAVNGERSICMFAATSAEEVRLMCRKVNAPFKRVWRSQLILPLEDDRQR